MAGVAEHAVMFPVDTIKTRMQALAHPGQRVSPLDLPLSTLMRSKARTSREAALSQGKRTRIGALEEGLTST